LSVAGGTSLFSIADGPPTMPLVQGGKIRALAVTGAERSSELPNVPSMAEAGYPDVNIGLWSGFFVSTNTPPAIVKKLAQQVIAAARDPAIVAQLTKLGIEANGTTPQEFVAQIAREQPQFDAAIKAANMTQ
ncbi:MAG: Bug family tripartite tricarboxylate transporter substrate binding protein, partial [Gammaproteobacteria bacterium]